MKIKQIYEIYEDMEKIELEKIRETICLNVKRIQLTYYQEYKRLNNEKRGTENPYSAINIASYLDLSYKYYQRLENAKDKSKYFSIDNLIKLAKIFEIEFEEYYKEKE